MKDNVRYVHLRTSEYGCLTMAVGEHKDGRRRIGVAFCAPQDSFSRKRGRTIARGRLYTGASVSCDSDSKVYDVCEGFAELLADERAIYDQNDDPKKTHFEPGIPRWIENFWAAFEDGE